MIHHRIEPQDASDDYRHDEDCNCDRCTEQPEVYCAHGNCPDDGCVACDVEHMPKALQASSVQLQSVTFNAILRRFQ